MAITDKVYLADHRSLTAQLGRSVPRSAFAGATLDILWDGEHLERMDAAARDRVVAFAADFMACDCRANPHCGHPEAAFIGYLLDLRAAGGDPEAMVETMRTDYGVEAYPGDVLSFLDDAIRTLEAVEQLAEATGEPAAARRARERREQLTG